MSAHSNLSPPLTRAFLSLAQFFVLQGASLSDTFACFKAEVAENYGLDLEKAIENSLGDEEDEDTPEMFDLEENYLMNALDHYSSTLAGRESLSANAKAGLEGREEKRRQEIIMNIQNSSEENSKYNPTPFNSDSSTLSTHVLATATTNVLAACGLQSASEEARGLMRAAYACADKSIHIIQYSVVDSGDSISSTPLVSLSCPAPVLVLSPHPHYVGLVAAGLMNGAVLLYQFDHTENTLTCIAQHNDPADPKYILNLRWSPSGAHLAAASYGGSLRVYAYLSNVDKLFQLHKTVNYSRAIEAVDWLNDERLYFCQHEDNILRLLHIHHTNAIGLPVEAHYNLNALQDDHISFTVLHIALSPCRRLLAVLTNMHRIIVLASESAFQVRNFYQVPADLYSNPKCLWSHDSHFLYVLGQDRQFYTLDILTGQGVSPELRSGHTDKIKQFAWADSGASGWITGGFDKTIRLQHRNNAIKQ